MTGEWRNRAGAMRFQGRGAIFVRGINGSFENRGRLPLAETEQLSPRAWDGHRTRSVRDQPGRARWQARRWQQRCRTPSAQGLPACPVCGRPAIFPDRPRSAVSGAAMSTCTGG